MNYSRRKFIKKGLYTTAAFAVGSHQYAAASPPRYPLIDPDKKIKIGILFSQTGVMKIYGRDLLNVSLMAIDDINSAGGINGAQLSPVVRDPGSQWPNYTKYAKELLQQNVNLIWGCIPSSSREATLPTVQRANGLLFYGTFYEGRECSPNMIATGAVPNQLIDASIPWMMSLAGKKIYIIGSNYIYPHTMSKQARIKIYQHGGRIVGDEFFSLDKAKASDFSAVVKDIIKEKPDWVLSNLVGVNTGAFLQAFKDAGLSADKMPILHTVLMETEIAAIGNELTRGHYSSVNYYQSINTPENHNFISHIRKYTTPHIKEQTSTSTVTAIMEGVYLGAMVNAKAMRLANSAHPDAIREAVRGMEITSPSGDTVKIDAQNLHTWLRPRIGRVNANNHFDIVYKSPELVRPEVFNPAMDKHRACIEGGKFYIRGNPVKRKHDVRDIIPQTN